MRCVVALLCLAALAACQVTTSQSMGGGLTIRHDVPLEGEHATEGQAQEDEDAEASEDRKPALTVGGGFSSGVSR